MTIESGTGVPSTVGGIRLPHAHVWSRLDARWKRLDSKAGRQYTPWDRGWKRDVYERVVLPVWPSLTAALSPVRPDGRLLARQVLERLPLAVVALARCTPLDDQERFLAAYHEPFMDPVGPVEPDCTCRVCAAARDHLAAIGPRAARLRDAFADQLAWHLALVLRAPNRYDRSHGAPRLLWRSGSPVRGQRPLLLPWKGHRDAPTTDTPQATVSGLQAGTEEGDRP